MIGALERPASARAAYLDKECGGDAELRAEVESLLASHDEAGEFIEESAIDSMAEYVEPTRELPPETRVGLYRLTSVIGEGGMGTVYRAIRDDDEFQNEVAIKILKHGMDADYVVERFRRERQILASLNHPNIARLFDGGTIADGRPYFVMELIHGKPLHEYCDSHHRTTPQRVELFRQICAALLYAHQHLVVHCDLKPGNILVTDDGTPKLLDFGIAKMLDPGVDNQEATVTVARMLTPEYASPEQIRGEPINTSTDIYSLGVIFYEILTGHRPYLLQTRRPHEVARAIVETDPPKPSTIIDRIEEVTRENGDKITLTPVWVSISRDGSPEKLRRRLRGDLDNIVLMAMRKDPQRRYPSVGHLMTDLQRHLEGLPVSARQDTVGYRASKFLERHRAAVITASFAIIALIASTIGTAWQAQVARRERARAERRFTDIRKVANSLLFDVHDAIKDLPGATSARQVIVSKALEFLDGLAKESTGDLALQRELATAYERVGDVQGKAREASLGDSRSALASYRKALALREAVAAADPNDQITRRDLAGNYGRLSDMMWSNGDSAAALEYCRKAVGACEQAAAASNANRGDRVRLAAGYLDYGFKLPQMGGDRALGLQNCRKSLAMMAELTKQDPSDRKLLRLQSLACNRTAELLEEDAASRSEALGLRRKAHEILSGLLARDPQNVDFRRLAAYTTYQIGDALVDLGDTQAALPYYPRAVATFDSLAAADPKNVVYWQDRAQVRLHYAAALRKHGETAKTADQYRRVVSEMTELARLRPLNGSAKELLATAERGLKAETTRYNRE
jgi:serine/threonine protein kinase/tetratricopeptide (TPR) repeat protein